MKKKGGLLLARSIPLEKCGVNGATVIQMIQLNNPPGQQTSSLLTASNKFSFNPPPLKTFAFSEAAFSVFPYYFLLSVPNKKPPIFR